jgi:endonuclease YncB( thermonuclease family)
MACTQKVVEVVDGDTIRVSPGWAWRGHSGEVVRILGYDAPERGTLGHASARQKLVGLVFGRTVVLRNPIRLTYGRLLCEVYVGGTNVAAHFARYAG